jgi:hypothetical protein
MVCTCSTTCLKESHPGNDGGVKIEELVERNKKK